MASSGSKLLVRDLLCGYMYTSTARFVDIVLTPRSQLHEHGQHAYGNLCSLFCSLQLVMPKCLSRNMLAIIGLSDIQIHTMINHSSVYGLMIWPNMEHHQLMHTIQPQRVASCIVLVQKYVKYV